MFKSLISAVILSMALAVPSVSMADSPSAIVQHTVNEVISVLKDPAFKGPAKESERRAKIKQTVKGVFNFREMAMRSLGQHWRKLSEVQRNEFVSLFQDLLERSYMNRIEGYSNEKIVYGNENIDGDYAVVKTNFITKRREEIPVDYKLVLENGKWSVYDMVIENVSLVNNYRTQFNKIITTSSYDDLVKKMKNKAESEAFAAPGKAR